MVEFISYNGKWPCLCGGTLVIKVDGKMYKLDYVLHSTGMCGFTDNYANSYVINGPWEVYGLPKELESYHDEIEQIVNENIPWGCCGGCL